MASKKQAAAIARQPTMSDVARLANVSQMTVSRVMRKTGYVSQDIIDRVQAASAQLGYVHNRIAGGLAGEKNALVGVVLPTLGNRVFTEVLTGITQALASSGVQPVFGVSEYSPQTEAALVEDLLSWRPMGLILPGLEQAEPVRKMVEASGIRTAQIMDVDGAPLLGEQAACFGFSQVRAGTEMAEHLLQKGYRRFGYVGCQVDLDVRAAKRRRAFIDTIERNGGQMVAERQSDEPSSMVVGRSLTADITKDATPPDVIYFANDDLASGGLMHCLAEGIAVPTTLALAGFNGLNFLQSMPLQVTTTRTPRYEIGFQAGHYVSGAQHTGPRLVDLGTIIEPGQTS
jgi:LacI family gluconate utilization system Gnt-I transcriptional repressor